MITHDLGDDHLAVHLAGDLVSLTRTHTIPGAVTKTLTARTGEDVVGAFDVLLGEKGGNKVDALQVRYYK